MKERLLNIKEKMKPWHWWVLIVAAFSIVGFVSIMGLTKDTYEVLYTDLTTDDAQEIERYLAESGIPYRSADEGATIEIVSDNPSKIKMELASQGLPGESNPGFELLDSTDLGATEEDKKAKYKRALKGQLEKDLVEGIDGIKKATVHFETPDEENIFLADESQEAKATVVLGLKSGKELNESQVKGIQNLISAAIEGLDPEKVVIVDENGSLISDVDGTSTSNKESDIVDQTEGRIKNDIVKSLSSVFGYSSVEVTVRAQINFDEIVQNIEKYDPEGTLVSRQETKSNSESRDAGQEESGTESNGDVPEYQTEDASGATSSQSSEEVIENFEVGKTVETIKKNPELTYLSVSVAVDQTMTQAEIDELEEYVAVSAGLMDEDKDGTYENGTVKVTPFVFKQNQESGEDTSAAASGNDLNMWWIYGIAGAVLLMVIAFILLLFSRRKKEEKIQEVVYMQEAAEKTEEEEIMEQLSKPLEMEEEKRMEEEMKRENLNKEATEAAEENPRRTAEYIKKLINER